MAWDALSALGSIAGALILLIGSVAAIVQLKHLRVANQLECYLQLMEQMHSPEMISARKYVETINQGVIQEDLFAGHIVTAPHIWDAIRPAIEVMRKRVKSPLFIDFQYLVYRFPHSESVSRFILRYPKEFVEAAGLSEYSAPR